VILSLPKTVFGVMEFYYPDSRTPSLQRQFWVKRESLIKKQIEDYLNTYDE